MNKLFWALGLSLVVISVLLIIIVKRGVIVRPQPLIKPTVIQENFEPVAKHVTLRMFPDFQSAEYVIWNINLQNPDALLFQSRILQEYAQLFQRPVHVLSDGQTLDTCKKPCWIFSAINLDQVKNFVQVNWVDFDQVESIPEECMNKKNLDSACLKFVSLKSVERKLKDPNARYFFLHKYLDRDFYLFVQTVRN